MAYLIKSLAATGRASVDLVSAALIAIGGLLVIGACVYRVFIHPEWPFDDALNVLWPFFLAGGACLTLGWLVDRSLSR
jgi:hypothetical protein